MTLLGTLSPELECGRENAANASPCGVFDRLFACSAGSFDHPPAGPDQAEEHTRPIAPPDEA